ncbi:hypothetical protein L596_028352 [Steinernema carpocapsae]|uniref:Palmitoyltransferase n=1 Tax=Steinernema carpocapsae TaxID=34508 RepID=A0A4U5LY89_STECR|nr:hypothetical protein L596_028352 [Steinernema carpocapsae]
MKHPWCAFVTSILSKVCLGYGLKAYFVAIVAFYFIFVYFFVIPFELLHKPAWLVYLLGTLGLYLFVNVLFYFFAASLTPPGSPPPQSTGNRLCSLCRCDKIHGTHHCSMCDVCVLKMDHHCAWMYQCIGARNHRYFVQFLGYISFSMILLLTAGWRTFYVNYYATPEFFCAVLPSSQPIYTWICPYQITVYTIFTFMLSVILFVLLGGFFIFQCLLVSIGTTYLEYLVLKLIALTF